MRYGAYVPNFGPYGDARILADLAYEAEEAGWDGFFLWDQVSKSTLTPTVDPMVDPWVALTAIALRTRTIRLGMLVTPLPRRRPWMVARETVSLDHLSAGRLIFGVGSGGGYFDFEALGEASGPTTLAALLEEGLEVLTGLWSGEPYRHEGTYYHIKEAQFLPCPVQSPRIPIWVAGIWPAKAPLRRAAGFDGVIPSTFLFSGPETRTAGPAGMSDLVIYALAVGMGLVLGSILGVPQWLALRRHVPKAGWWILANAAAWLLGMVVVFMGTSFIPVDGITWPVALVLLLFVVAAGTVVGAVHGLMLIWLLHLRHLRTTA
jgi:hypothetical protein